MSKVMFFIDGFNVYHSLKDNPAYQKYLWLDFRTLAERFKRKQDTISGIYYFSAYATWKPHSMKRHRMLVDALKSKGVNIVMGKFKEKDRYCKECGADISEEKKQYWIIEKLGGLEFDFIGIGITPLEDVKLSKSYDWDALKRDYLKANAIILIIDITLPDSQIESEVMEWVRKYRAFVSSKYPKDIPQMIEDAKFSWEKYKTYLKVWELKQQGYTHEEGADGIFPGVDLDIARTRITRNLKSIRNFIGGPYRRRRTRDD